MNLKSLRKEFRHAFKMKRLTRQRGWANAVRRLNALIMKAEQEATK